MRGRDGGGGLAEVASRCQFIDLGLGPGLVLSAAATGRGHADSAVAIVRNLSDVFL